MIPHGRAELQALARSSAVVAGAEVQGWDTDTWTMTDRDIDLSVQAYEAILLGNIDDEIRRILQDGGIDLDSLLIDETNSKDDITRSDVTEIAAAATLIAVEGCDVGRLNLPNVPKMSRKKSDSGIDAMVPVLVDSTLPDLQVGEELFLVSVKHSIQRATSSVRSKLVTSLSVDELSMAYMATQLRVLNGRLIQEGVSEDVAKRVYLFLRDFPGDAVHLIAVAAVDVDSKDDLIDGYRLLPSAGGERRTFRGILIKGIANLHERCR